MGHVESGTVSVFSCGAAERAGTLLDKGSIAACASGGSATYLGLNNTLASVGSDVQCLGRLLVLHRLFLGRHGVYIHLRNVGLLQNAREYLEGKRLDAVVADHVWMRWGMHNVP